MATKKNKKETKTTPHLRFTEEEAVLIKRIAGVEIPANITKVEIREMKENEEVPKSIIQKKTSAKKLKELEAKERMRDKSRKLLEKNPDFIFGETASEHIEMIWELYISLIIAKKEKKLKVKTSLLKKILFVMEKHPEPEVLNCRIYPIE